MLCAKLPKCNITLFPEDDIKIYDASKSTAIFSRTQSCLYQYLWICKALLEDTLSWRNLLLSKRNMFSLTIFLDAPIYELFFQNLKDTRRCGWLRIVMEYNRRMEWFQTAWKFDYKGGDGYNDDWWWWWWYCRVHQGTWETRMAAGFAPRWSETGYLWKILRRITKT